MALIKCPECGKDVSDKAPTCIHCGYPLSDTVGNVMNANNHFKETANNKDILAPGHESPKDNDHQSSITPANNSSGCSQTIGLWACIIIAVVCFIGIGSSGSVVVACLVAIAFLLLGGFIFSTAPKEFHDQVKAVEEEKEEKRMNGGYKCPNCGKMAGHPIGAIDKGVSVGMLGLTSNKIGKSYKCANCDYMW